MAGEIPDVAAPEARLSFSRARVTHLLDLLERMAAGDTAERLPISDAHDELDAIAHGINVLVGEVRWESARVIQAQEARAEELRHAVSRAERANESKSIFLRNVNHEIRTPIAAMMWCADLLASIDLPHEAREDAARGLRANGQAVVTLIEDLLDLARIEAGKIVLVPEPVSLLDLVRDAQSSLEPELRRKGLSLHINVHGAALAPFRSDRHRIRQILVNLIANAVKFTDAGGVVVSLLSPQDGSERLLIDVADTGIGIPSDRQAFLFQPFEQIDPSIPRTYGGTGLGLALSARLAAQLNGALTLLESVPGRGTTFRLELAPLPDSHHDGPAPEASSTEASGEGRAPAPDRQHVPGPSAPGVLLV
jgi:signal transduction histidine kinase